MVLTAREQELADLRGVVAYEGPNEGRPGGRCYTVTFRAPWDPEPEVIKVDSVPDVLALAAALGFIGEMRALPNTNARYGFAMGVAEAAIDNDVTVRRGELVAAYFLKGGFARMGEDDLPSPEDIDRWEAEAAEAREAGHDEEGESSGE